MPALLKAVARCCHFEVCTLYGCSVVCGVLPDRPTHMASSVPTPPLPTSPPSPSPPRWTWFRLCLRRCAFAVPI